MDSKTMIPIRYNSHNHTEYINFLPAVSIGFLTVNMITAIFRAHSHNDNSTISFILFLYFRILSLLCCFKAFDWLPTNEESLKKDCLKVVTWTLSTALNLGVAVRFGVMVHPIGLVVMVGLATATSLAAFYILFIYKNNTSSSDDAGHKNNMKSPSSVEKLSEGKIKSPQTFSPILEEV